MFIYFNENLVNRTIAQKVQVDDVTIDTHVVQIWWRYQTPEMRTETINIFKQVFPDKHIETYSIRIRLGEFIDYFYKFS